MYKIILVFAFIWFLLGLFVFINSQTPKVSTVVPTETPTPTPKLEINADKLFQLVNTWRIENDYQPFKDSEFACSVAEKRLPEIRVKFSHEGFYYQRFCTNCQMGENLIQGYIDEEAALQGWINSPTHFAMLQSSHTHACIKCTIDSCVHIFSNF